MDRAVSKVSMKPGTLVVYEGLDATGKTTQMDRLRVHSDAIFEDPVPVFTHQPSGGTAVGKYVYQITENVNILTDLGRQFLHLASHSEHYMAIIKPALHQRAVFMDRCWWSTFAYSWFGRLENDHRVDLGEWLKIIQMPTLGIMPDVVFYFTEPHTEDAHNDDDVVKGYEYLASFHGHPSKETQVVRVPKESPGYTTGFIFGHLAEMELCDVEWEEA